ncbi:MAG: retention module-containing protein, partial [Aquitalea sp.]|nr:retention module-containing protein [Aquitalea sp.]
MNAPAIQGQVVALHGVVKVIDAQGHERLLKVGDIIQPGEHVVLLDGATLTVARADGDSLTVDGPRDLSMTDETLMPHATDKTEAAVAKLAPEAQQVLAALENGQDPLAQLDSAAAGLNAGSGADEGSHSFVRLVRVSESLNTLTLDSATTTASTAQTVVGDTSTPQATATTAVAPVSVTIDNVSATNNATPTIHGTGVAGLTVVVTNAAGTVIGTAVVASNGTWSLVPTSALPDGTDTLIATSTNTAGVSASATGSAIIDTTAPATPTVTITEHNDPNGVIGSSDLLNGKVQAVVQLSPADLTGQGTATITVKDGSLTVVLTVNASGTVSSSNSSIASGSYDATTGKLTLSIADQGNGSNVSVSATQTDSAGNVSGTGSDSGTVVSMVAPTGSLSHNATDDTGSSSTDSITSNTTPHLSGTAEAGSSVSVTVAGHTYTTTADSNGNWSVQITNTLTAGTYTPSITTTDAAGNTETANGTAFTVEVMNAPTGGLTHDAKDDTGVSSTDSITNNNHPQLSGTAEPGSAVSVTVDGTTYQTTADSHGGWSINISTSLPDGSYTPVITTTDVAGNAQTVNGTPFTVDTTAPATPTVVITEHNDPNGQIASGDLNSAGQVQASVTLNAGDLAKNGSATIVVNDGGQSITLTVNSDGSISGGNGTVSGSYSNGVVSLDIAKPTDGSTVSVTATQTDSAGNVSGTGSDSGVVNTTAPATPAVHIVDHNGVISSTDENSSGQVTVNVSLSGNVVVGDVVTFTNSTNNTTQTHTVTAADLTAGHVSFETTAPSSGTLNVQATITDTVGNVSQPGS